MFNHFILQSKRLVLIFFLMGVFGFLKGQDNVLEKVKEHLHLADSLSETDAPQSVLNAEKAVELARNLNDDSLNFECVFQQGISNFYASNYNDALKAFINCKEIAKKTAKKQFVIKSLNAIANTYKNYGRYDAAISAYNEAMSYIDQNKVSNSLILVKSNLIGLYRELNKVDSSLLYCYEVLALLQKHGTKSQTFVSNMYGDMLFGYMALKNKDSIAKYEKLALETKRASGDEIGLASFLHNIAGYYNENGDLQKAEKYFRESLTIDHGNIQLVYMDKIELAENLKKQKKFEEASRLYAESYLLVDSINKLQTIEKMSEMEVKYETGKKEEELKRIGAEKEISDLKAKQSRLWLWVSSGGILFVLIIMLVLFKQNKIRKEANKLLQRQNDEIVHQKKEITDSINYAKRIQLAILPPDKMVKRLLPNSFVFYKPKDVVSGDFYWVEEKNGTVMFAAVDCTGHGVPGAMMSVVGLNLLNQAVKEKGLTKPSDILQHLDTGVTDTLRQSGDKDSIKDGMDLSLCSYNPKTLELQYAGAFNNLWVVRDKVSSSYKLQSANEVFFEEHLLEIKADKFPIGSNLDGVADNYSNYKIQLQKGDCVYLYSDGFADQFGGPRGKKFKYNYLKKLLISLRELSPEEQREKLLSTIENWRGNLDQVDDILVIGVCI